MSDSYRPHELQPTRLLCPWVFQARVLEWGVIALKSLSFQNVVTDFWLRWVSSAVSGLLGLYMKGSLRKFNSSYIEENALKLAKDQMLESFRILFKGEN